MVWMDIKDYENYGVNNFGQIMNKKSHKILKQTIKKDGYVKIKLSKNGNYKFFNVHRLVAQAFIPNPENKPCVNHKDGNKQNNCVDNLEWCTRSENIQHALNNGLIAIFTGENVSNHKLSESDVIWIREHYIPRNKIYGLLALSKKFNVKKETVQAVILNKTWKNVVMNK